jgi:DNA-binding LacI/PurR family transcriptional regulator
MGIDDIPAAAEAVIPLTTISQPKREQGLAAAQILFDLIEGKPGKNIILTPELVVRETA